MSHSAQRWADRFLTAEDLETLAALTELLQMILANLEARRRSN